MTGIEDWHQDQYVDTACFDHVTFTADVDGMRKRPRQFREDALATSSHVMLRSNTVRQTAKFPTTPQVSHD